MKSSIEALDGFTIIVKQTETVIINSKLWRFLLAFPGVYLDKPSEDWL